METYVVSAVVTTPSTTAMAVVLTFEAIVELLFDFCIAARLNWISMIR